MHCPKIFEAIPNRLYTRTLLLGVSITPSCKPLHGKEIVQRLRKIPTSVDELVQRFVDPVWHGRAPVTAA